MTSCEHFQARMLEHVYGLLEPEDGRELTQHLEACAACRRALERAEKEQGILAAAAKRAFPDFRFEAPSREPVAEVVPLGLGRGPGWFRWAVAAGILLAVVGVGVATGVYSQERDRLDRAEARFDQAREQSAKLDTDYRKLCASRDQTQKEVEDIQKEINDLQVEEQKAEQKIWQEASSQRFRMAISGPKTPLPGAPNAYTITTHSINDNQPAKADVTVKVRDEKDKVVYEVKKQSNGTLPVQLPPDLPLKANDEMTLEVSAKIGDKVEMLADKLKLIAPVYLTHLTTDKPMYQPGETVRFRSLTLERFSLRPPPEDLSLIYTVTRPNGQQVQVATGLSQLVNENGVPFVGPDKKPLRGLGGGEYVIAEAIGGEYTLSVRDAGNRFPEQKRKFMVNVYEKPRLNKKLEFARRSYGPGEKVRLTATAKRAENEGLGLANQPVTAVLNIDGQTIEATRAGLRTDKNGSIEIEFKALPKTIARGDASASVTFTDGGSVETIVRPVPIVLSKLEVEFFPEGGDLVAGVPNRVYFQTRTTLGKPAELKGRILDDSNVVACNVETFGDPKIPGANQGMGVFTFTPLERRKYHLQVDVPAGITELVGPKNTKDGQFLPAPKSDRIVLSVPTGVTTQKEAIRAVVQSTKTDRHVLVGAYCRGRLLTHQRVQAKAGEAVDVDLRPEGSDGGVIRVTVFEEERNLNGTTELIPVAERLVYRVPGRKLNLSIQTDRPNYTPGERVKLVCLSSDEKGQKAPAIVMVAVVDKSVLTMADEKTFRQMPTHFLLTTEVRRPEDLEHADFLLGNDPKGAIALDLLLGTQGWRRFAEQKPGQFRQRHPQEADQVLVLNNNFTIDNNRLAFDKVQRVAEVYSIKAEAKAGQLIQARRTLIDLYSDDRLVRERRELEEQSRVLKGDYDRALASATAFATRFGQVKKIALPAFGLALLIVGLFGLARAILQQNRAQMIPYLVGAGCCFALFAATVVVPIGPDGSSIVAKALSLDAPAWAEKDDVVAKLDPNMMPEPTAARVEKEAERLMELADPKTEAKGEGRGKGGGKGDGQGRALPPAKKPGNMPAGDILDGKKKLGDDKARPENHNGAAMRRFGVPPPAAPAPALAAPRPMAAEQKPEAAKKAKEGLELWKARAGANRDRLGDQQKDMKQQLQPPHGFGGLMRMPDVGKRAAGMGAMLDARELPLAAAAPLVVREYAHYHERKDPKIRDDETETVYWHPVLVLHDGKGEVSFQLSTQPTTFQVLAAGHTLDGRLGAVTAPIESRLPLTVEPKLPTEVTQGDVIDVPVSIANNTSAARSVDVTVKPEGLALKGGKATESVSVAADGRARKVWRLSPTLVEGEATLTIEGSAKNLESDSKVSRFKVVPAGFPIVSAKSDLLEKTAIDSIELPKDLLPGTLKVQVAVYPSTLADLQKGLEALLREPNGCFEQTSTSNYPNLLILNYLKESDQAKDKPQVVAHAKDLLGRGYAKLTSFECLNVPDQKKRGYEWFGGTAPAHEALTAYGLMQFRDMAAVYDVDPIMVERTKAWLMSRKDNKGGFQRNPRALDTFGRAPDHITNAYIVWALTESSKDDDVTKELEAAFAKAQTSKDPYFVALVSNALLNRNRANDAIDLLSAIGKLQKDDGHLDAQETSITGSGGRDLQIETTSLAVLGWLKAQRPELFTKNIQMAVRWLSQQRGGYGGFGSTQSTILTLKALIAYAKANKRAPEDIELTITIADKVIQKKFPAGTADALILEVPDAEKVLKAGKNSVQVTSSSKNPYPYTLTWSYRALTPVSAEKCSVRLSTKLAKSNVREGESVRLTATIENVSGKGQGMALAILGLPAGLTIPEDMKQLKDLAQLKNDGTERGTIDFFEIRGRELVLYWRDLAPGKKIDVNLDLIARVPGEYKGPASRAYLYYNADHKHWVEPLAVKIAANREAAAK